jgi:hypothetical protein
MPTFRHGKNTRFSIQDSAGTLRDISDVLREVSMPRQIDTPETTAFLSAYKTFVIGIPGATFNVSGMFDLTVDGYLNGIYALETARNFEYGPEGNTATRRKFTGACYLTNYQISGSVSDMVSFSADFQITGAVTAGVYP